MTESTLIQAFIQSGWAGLALVLIAWLLRRNDEREARLMTFIETEIRAMREDVRNMREDARQIKDYIIEQHDTGPLRRSPRKEG